MPDPGDSAYDWDLFVIGGGSGGLAASKTAAALGARVAVADFVKPSPQGTTWGLGGTCVNVGCIPKKLFHMSAQTAETEASLRCCDRLLVVTASHNWDAMIRNVTTYISSLNWGYKSELRSNNVKYYNSFATFIDKNTLKLTDKRGREVIVTARYILIATGGRPNLGGYPGAEECCISSDDIFRRSTPPGKTLVVGASYIALESAGFIAGFGYDTTVMVRSILLRGFDQDMAERIGKYMENHGTKFAREMVPTKFERTEDGKVRVYAKGASDISDDDGTEFGVFDTVLMAVGRTGCAGWLSLDNAGVHYDAGKGKIPVDKEEKTNIDNIYAIGDVVEGMLELTPVAIQSGKMLAERLFGGASKLMDYHNVPTTVFTPIEYASVGMSEENARDQYGDDLIVYHSFFKPLLWALNKERGDADCYMKVICENKGDRKVVGVHILGPDAGEMIQGLAVAMKAGCTKAHLDDTVGIHPTCAETFTTLTQIKEDGQDAAVGGSC
ncbi:thioredoxin reductase [Perkinsus olseni]|uniref:thioredoxin-disulfide reductase (NADPH) n=1 Tax=Perkinsus olseni TaxID=32597 RepID=A0A7J6MX96_PEROL|nr:thioredoxin reductase [Perkinsus olseni]KAF4676248.1 thioredoxin reductase [Perkinsus olseni]